MNTESNKVPWYNQTINHIVQSIHIASIQLFSSFITSLFGGTIKFSDCCELLMWYRLMTIKGIGKCILYVIIFGPTLMLLFFPSPASSKSNGQNCVFLLFFTHDVSQFSVIRIFFALREFSSYRFVHYHIRHTEILTFALRTVYFERL